MQTSFDFKIESVKIRNGTGLVVRDDLLEGGTKQRAIVPYLQSLTTKGFSEFIYASPFSGFAQVALASSLKYLDVQCTVFCEPTLDGTKHRFSRLAEKMGATIILCESLKDAEEKATAYSQQSLSRYKVPLGFNDEKYRSELSLAISALWDQVSAKQSPKNLWLPVGSGTLAQVFRQVVSPSVRLECIDVHVLKGSDQRIKDVRNLENTAYRGASLQFHEACSCPCPIPSNLYYDSKVYQVFAEEAADGDLWWNVAR